MTQTLRTPTTEDRRMCARTCLLTIICVVEFWTNTRSFVAAESCDTVRDKCATRVGCGMALYNLYLGCNTVMSGRSDTCTVRCQSALVSLLTAEDEVGREFINCGCNTASCEPTKRRVQNCSKAVLAAMDNLEDDTKVVSCTLAEWICQADTSCYTALRFYLKHCSRMLKGDKCTSRCNNSLNILYRQPKAKKMWNCRCMGDEEFNCLEIRRNTRQLCYNDYRFVIFMS